MKDNIVAEKSRHFAVRIVRLYQYLIETKKEYVLSKQILRAGTSIGANVAEALAAVSRKDSHAKMQIAFKECYETEYWLTLLFETGYVNRTRYQSLKRDRDELHKLLSSITKSTRE